jgi:hypothetical protein
LYSECIEEAATMRRVGPVVILVLCFPLFSSAATDILQQLGLTKDEAAAEVVAAFATGGVSYDRVGRAFKATTPGVRAVMVEQVLSWTKAYVSSPQFGRHYAVWREQQKPQRPDDLPTADEELAKIDAERKAHLDELKKSITNYPAEYRAVAEESYRAALVIYKESDTPQHRQMMRQIFQEDRVARQTANERGHEQAMRRWSETYPATPEKLVRQRLEEFLARTEGVDFDAKLVSSGGVRTFAKPEYERKPSEWKLAYRTGREPTERARSFAQAWLKELR